MNPLPMPGLPVPAAAFDMEKDLLATADAKGYFTSLNKAWEHTLGWTREELMSKPFIHFVHPDHVEQTMEMTAKVGVPDYEVLRFENRYEVKGGGWRWLRWYARSDGSTWVAVAFDVTENRAAERELRAAIGDGRLVAYTQPIIDQTRIGDAAEELLARITPAEADEEPIIASEFIPLAEDCGLISEIDRFMLGEALRMASRGRRVHVNVSARSICDPAVSREILDVLETAEPYSGEITVEITETAAIEAVELARDFGEALGRLGIGLALDDFGTRFASLNYLRHLPVRCLKIDRSFITNLPHDRDDQKLVRSIVAIARELGLDMVAEGVETPEALALLHSYGVDRAQGYFIGRPTPITV